MTWVFLKKRGQKLTFKGSLFSFSWYISFKINHFAVRKTICFMNTLAFLYIKYITTYIYSMSIPLYFCAVFFLCCIFYNIYIVWCCI